MGIVFIAYKNGEEFIRLTEHSITNIILSVENLTIDAVAKSLAIEGIFNTDLIGEVPRPLLDEYGNQIVDENGNPKFHLREFDSVRMLVEWAFSHDVFDCYCDVSVVVNDASGNLVNKKFYECMFVTGYKEKYDENHTNGIFNIFMRERVLDMESDGVEV